MTTRKKTATAKTKPRSKRAAETEVLLPKTGGEFVASYYGPYVSWFDNNLSEEGGNVAPEFAKDISEKFDWSDPDAVDNWRFLRVCADITKLLPEDHPKDYAGFVFEDDKQRQKYVSLANKLLRELKTRKAPMPDWAVQALAHGWKPPKGRTF